MYSVYGYCFFYYSFFKNVFGCFFEAKTRGVKVRDDNFVIFCGWGLFGYCFWVLLVTGFTWNPVYVSEYDANGHLSFENSMSN